MTFDIYRTFQDLNHIFIRKDVKLDLKNFYKKSELDLGTSKKLTSHMMTMAILEVSYKENVDLSPADLLEKSIAHLAEAFKAKKLFEFSDKINILGGMKEQHFQTLSPLFQDVRDNLADKLERMTKLPMYAHLAILDVIRVMFAPNCVAQIASS